MVVVKLYYFSRIYSVVDLKLKTSIVVKFYLNKTVKSGYVEFFFFLHVDLLNH